MKKALTLSIIIPVYNEERRLKACLDAITTQTVMANEVIVVDNNSTDKSVEIAKSYPFVRIVKEKKQGFTYARNAGFEAASCDILARIDADSVMNPTWVECVIRNFSSRDIDGLTGLGYSDFLPRIHGPKTVLPSWLYFMWSVAIFRLPVLWGANMAIRKSAWRRIVGKVHMDNSLVHEDQDIALCILEEGGRLHRDNKLRITIGGQTYHYLPKLWYYTRRMYTTKQLHAKRAAFHRIKRPYSRTLVFFLWLVPAPILLCIFFGSSLVMFPLDFAVKTFGWSDAWLD